MSAARARSKVRETRPYALCSSQAEMLWAHHCENQKRLQNVGTNLRLVRLHHSGSTLMQVFHSAKKTQQSVDRHRREAQLRESADCKREGCIDIAVVVQKRI
eukprot:scaffold37606_cov27-Tisochrysis_lutea.AAC.4